MERETASAPTSSSETSKLDAFILIFFILAAIVDKWIFPLTIRPDQ